MINAIDVLRVLEAFRTLKAASDIPEDAKKLIAAELLPLVPPDIMTPNAKATSEYVRNTLREYITDGNANRKAEEARIGAKEVPAIRQPLRPENHQEVAGSGDRDRVQEPSKGAMGRPGVAGEEARGDEKRQARKAARRS